MANSNVIKLDRESMEWRISTRRMEAESLWKRNNQLTKFYTPNNTIYDVYKRGYWKRDRWVVEGLFRAGSNVMIVGESNVGKTYIILDMLLNIVLGRKWFNMYKCDVGPTIYTGGEGNKDFIIRRIVNLLNGYGVSYNDFMREYEKCFIISMPEDYMSKSVTPLADEKYQEEMLQFYASIPFEQRPRGFGEDPITALHPEVDKNPHLIKKTINFLTMRNRICDAITVLAHHPKKNQQQGGKMARRDRIRGESSWVNFLDDVYYVEADDKNPETILFFADKARDGIAPRDKNAVFGVHRSFEDYDGVPGASPGAIKTTSFETKWVGHKKPEAKGTKIMQDALHTILELLKQTDGALTADGIVAALGMEKNTAVTAIDQLARDGKVFPVLEHDEHGVPMQGGFAAVKPVKS